MPRTYTPETLEPATTPTFYFIGVTTENSSIRTVFPRWADELGLGDVELVGIDVPIHAPAEQYRRVVSFLRDDIQSLGALITTHKIDLFHAASDLFEEIAPLATLMSEVSCISKRGGVFRASAKDPYSSGLALDAFVPQAYWASDARELFIMGAGGSAIAMDWYLCHSSRSEGRPKKVIVSNRSAERLETFRSVHTQVAPDIELEIIVAARTADNDAVLERLSEGAVIVNATGLGKDAPGSPLSDAASFPTNGVAWDLNYRGDLIFLDQARAQQYAKNLYVEDGWVYFLHGWTQVIADVFGIEIPTSGPSFDRLSELAGSTR